MAAISPQAFLRRVRGAELARLFDLLPDMSFFIKDRQGRFMAVNRRGCDYCGVKHEKDAIGKTDLDFFPHSRAIEYQEDDETVMRTGKPIVNRLESAPEAEGSPRLVMSSKIPLRDAEGNIIGVAGFSRQLDQVRSHSSGEARFAKVIEHMHQQPDAALSSAAMARMCGLSQSQFDRSFRRVCGSSARQYLLRGGRLPSSGGDGGNRGRAGGGAGILRPRPFHPLLPPHHGADPGGVSGAEGTEGVKARVRAGGACLRRR